METSLDLKPSKLAICAAAYYVLASGEILKIKNDKDEVPRKRRRCWVNAYYKSRNK